MTPVATIARRIFFGTLLSASLLGLGYVRAIVRAGRSVPEPTFATRVPAACPPAVAGDRRSDATRADVLPFYLNLVHEPALSCGDARPDTYRLDWIRPSGEALIVRVERAREGWILTATSIARPEPPSAPVFTTRTTLLSAAEGRQLDAALRASGFWAMPAEPRARSVSRDGSRLAIEGRRGTGYRMVTRTSADAEGAPPFLRLCLVLGHLSRLTSLPALADEAARRS